MRPVRSKQQLQRHTEQQYHAKHGTERLALATTPRKSCRYLMLSVLNGQLDTQQAMAISEPVLHCSV